MSATLIGMQPNFAFYMVAIANGASAVGRLITGGLAVTYGPVNILIVFLILVAAFIYAWPFITSNAGFVVVTVLYG